IPTDAQRQREQPDPGGDRSGGESERGPKDGRQRLMELRQPRRDEPQPRDPDERHGKEPCADQPAEEAGGLVEDSSVGERIPIPTVPFVPEPAVRPQLKESRPPGLAAAKWVHLALLIHGGHDMLSPDTRQARAVAPAAGV